MRDSAINLVAIEKECKHCVFFVDTDELKLKHACFLYNANDASCAIKKPLKRSMGINSEYSFIGNRWQYLAYDPKPN